MYQAFNKIVVDAINEYGIIDCNDNSRVVAWEPLAPGTLDKDSAIKRLGVHFDKVVRRISGESNSATNRHFNKLEAAVIMEVLKSILLEDGIFHDILVEKASALAPILDKAIPCIIELYYKHIVCNYTNGQTVLFPIASSETEQEYFTERIYLTEAGYLTYSSILEYTLKYGVNVEDLFRIHSSLLKKDCHQIIEQFFDDTKSLAYEGLVDAFFNLKEGLKKSIPAAKEVGLLKHRAVCWGPCGYVDAEGHSKWVWDSDVPDFFLEARKEQKPPR